MLLTTSAGYFYIAKEKRLALYDRIIELYGHPKNTQCDIRYFTRKYFCSEHVITTWNFVTSQFCLYILFFFGYSFVQAFSMKTNQNNLQLQRQECEAFEVCE
jgi:hypothetical protein